MSSLLILKTMEFITMINDLEIIDNKVRSKNRNQSLMGCMYRIEIVL